MEVVMVYMLLTWNDPVQESMGVAKPTVHAHDSYYRSEDDCWTGAKNVFRSFRELHVACVKTMITKSEQERLDKLMARIEKGIENWNRTKSRQP